MTLGTDESQLSKSAGRALALNELPQSTPEVQSWEGYAECWLPPYCLAVHWLYGLGSLQNNVPPLLIPKVGELWVNTQVQVCYAKRTREGARQEDPPQWQILRHRSSDPPSSFLNRLMRLESQTESVITRTTFSRSSPDRLFQETLSVGTRDALG